MHNFDDLQKRYQKYRVKQAMKYILVIFVIFLAIALYLFSTVDTKLPLKSKVLVKNSSKKQPIQKVKKTIAIETKSVKKYFLQFLVTSKKHIKQINKKKKLLKSLGFQDCKLIQPVAYFHLVCNESNSLEGLKSAIKLAKKNHLDYYVLTHHTNTQQTREKEKKEDKQDEKKTQHIKKDPTPMLKVQNTNTKQLQKNFSQAPNYNVAIIIARSYYKKGAFKNAIIWAKKANQLDKNDAVSWIIYAKSLYALHQENKARQLLHIYLQYENSEKVVRLLKIWEKNQ